MSNLNVKQFKKKLIRGLANPDLFKLPLKDDVDEYEPMIIKVLVTDTDNKMTICARQTNSIYIYYSYYSYLNMEEEYANNNNIQMQSTTGYLLFKNSVNSLSFYYNFKVKDPSKILITDDIDYFRDSADCLYKPHDKNITDVIYSKFCTQEPTWCEVDWGDGTVENGLVEHFNNDNLPFSFDYIKSDMIHTYENTGEYYIKIRGRIPTLSFYKTFGTTANYNIELQEVVQWGNLHLYSINNLFDHMYRNQVKFKMPTHIPSYSFKNVVSAYRAFYNCAIDESEFSQEIIFDFVNTFPNLLNGSWMFEKTNISYIPKYFCYNHKNIISCQGMFGNSPITYIGERAFANCDNLTDVYDLTYNSSSDQPLPLLTKVEDGIFENDINLLKMDFAFNYISIGSSDYSLKSLYTDESLGLKTVGNNIFKNCKRLRYACEPFYQQAGLVSVGDGLFEGCEDLISVELCFHRCYSLKKIGDNIFKGCTKVRNCNDFCCECYLVNFPDKMFYDLKYYDYLKGISNYIDFNGYWNNISEQDGQISYDGDDKNRLEEFLKIQGYNHNNFPTRKHSKDLFSKEYLIDCINHGDVIFDGSYNEIFRSIITISNHKFDNFYDTYIISNFTGEAFPVWEISGWESLFKSLNIYNYVFGIRNIKVKMLAVDSHTLIEYWEYGCTINYYDNYMDMARVDPIICRIRADGSVSYAHSKMGLLNTYYHPFEGDNFKVLECNDPIEYEYVD